jgi:hypothetical protein
MADIGDWRFEIGEGIGDRAIELSISNEPSSYAMSRSVHRSIGPSVDRSIARSPIPSPIAHRRSSMISVFE